MPFRGAMSVELANSLLNYTDKARKNCGPSTIQQFNQPKLWTVDYPTI